MLRTMSTLILFSVIILLLLYFFQIIFLNYSYESYKVNQVNNISKKLGSNEKDIGTYLSKVSVENDVCAEYVTEEGAVLYNEGIKGCILKNPNTKILSLMESMYSSSKTTVFYKITNPVFKSKTLLYGTRLSNGNYVFLNSQLESLDNTTVILKNQLIYLTLIVIILSVLMAFFVSNSITKPIREITKKAKEMGNGNLNVIFQSSNISEINELSETLNYAKNEMVRTDDYRRDLMANVSHDLKTPLTLIKSYAEMVRDITYKNDEKRNDHLNVIINETDRLNGLVNDILTLSKVEANADTLKVEDYDLVEQINEIIKKFEILELTESYHFELNVPDKLLIKADRNKMGQVIYNLVNNAVNYTGDDMIVYINVNKRKDGYLVEIIDTGKGIDDETIKHIWDRYYKTEKKHKRNKVGTGLGLSIVKCILENHGFKYGVKSSLGKGTNFYFIIKK